MDRMLASMTGQQLLEWTVYAEMEPFGEERADLRMAILAATIVNAVTRSKDSDPIAEPKDFMPKFESNEEGEHAGSPQLSDEEDAESEKRMNVEMKLDAYFSALAQASGRADT